MSINLCLGRYKKILCIFLLFLLLICLVPGNFLTYSEVPRKSDVIIVLSGDEGRLEKAISLYQQNYAPLILLSNAGEKGWLSHIKKWVDRDQLLLEWASISTQDNATYTKEMMKEQELRSAIIVTSNYHMRRTKLLFEKEYRGSDITLNFVSSDSFYQSYFWWTSKKGLLITGTEYIKMVGNSFGIHGGVAKKIIYAMFERFLEN
ncbi:YdcF family protein [Bacillus sp. 2205SS5-2]|uniref:YdcF family protein n=1 Tax=Bacillus sp. 2205SS5-2 TaxID=3109031 RepID=UPI00300486A0